MSEKTTGNVGSGQDVHVELKRTSDGVSLSVYEAGEDGQQTVVDEAWWTWAEFLGGGADGTLDDNIDGEGLPDEPACLNATPTAESPAVDTARPAVGTIDLSWLPDEIVAFAFDQFHDRLFECITGAGIGHFVEPDSAATLDYGTQAVAIHQTAVGGVLSQLLNEKIETMKQEIEAGDRDDFTVDELNAYRRTLNTRLSATNG